MKKSKIIRFTQLPDGVIARYDEKKNILLVDRFTYEHLPEFHQGMVLKTTNSELLQKEVPVHQTIMLYPDA